MRLLRHLVDKFGIKPNMHCILHLDAGGYVLVNSALRSVISEKLGTAFPLHCFLPFPGMCPLIARALPHRLEGSIASTLSYRLRPYGALLAGWQRWCSSPHYAPSCAE